MSNGLQHAADLAERYGDTRTQDTVKKMQYPYATGFWNRDDVTDPSLYPSEARQQRYRTQARSFQRSSKRKSRRK